MSRTTLVLLLVLVAVGCAPTHDSLVRREPGLHRVLRLEGESLPSRTVIANTKGDGSRAVRVVVEEIGRHRSDRLVVLLHGAFSSRTTWRYLAGDLGQDHDLLLVDLPGCGESDRPAGTGLRPGEYAPSILARRVLEATRPLVLGRSERPRVTLVGHSLGAAVALQIVGDPTLRAEFSQVLDQIDGLVLEVLINKHKKIRAATGVSVPVPATSNSVLEALYEGLLLRNRSHEQLMLDFEDGIDQKGAEFSIEWQNAADREKKSRSLFAQNSIKPDEVAGEVASALDAIGSTADLENFVSESVRSLGGTCTDQDHRYALDLTETPRPIRESIQQMLSGRKRGAIADAFNSITPKSSKLRFNARFHPVVATDEEYLSRTHPVVEALTSYVMDSALDSTAGMQSVARRCGAIRTDAVSVRTTLLLLRLRYHILVFRGDEVTPLLAEDSLVVGFESAPSNARWLPVDQAEKLLTAKPTSNITPDIARESLEKILREFDVLQPQLNAIAESHGKRLLDSHQRVRTASQRRHIRYGIEPQLPPDVLGVYLYLPSA